MIDNNKSSAISNLKASLEGTGFFNYYHKIDQLFKLAKISADNAGSSKTPSFEALVSFIPSHACSLQRRGQLIIDIGGTSTKVGLKHIGNQSATDWLILFELDNNEFKNGKKAKSCLESYALNLGQKIITECNARQVPADKIKACAIVWSNAFRSEPSQDPTGITGIVEQKEMYKKGEWFNQDLKNGTDLGALFNQAFKESGIVVDTLIVGNDTPLTMKALSRANGGMVASTGLNGTLVKDLVELGLDSEPQKVICNAEMGGRFFLDTSYLSSFDLASNRQESITIEELCAGGFLPRIFIDYIIGLSDSGHEELTELADRLSGLPDNGYSFLRSEDISGFMENPELVPLVQSEPEMFTSATLKTLQELAQEIFIRAARLCAVVAYGTVCNQVEPNTNLVVALDSSLYRNSQVFRDYFDKQLALAPAQNEQCNIIAKILEPLELSDGKISVPMQGAANALDCF